ncbi:hypothetical protein GCM10008935_14110 [Alkalibacillus silvisoli]|uniref:Uncharacterized protein n=2 Tax=Alkalibacillus silvisoli TaxID=392823 RepID=A0ABP3JQZ5_9BACI
MNTKVIILGVGHSNQLVSESCQPAVYRAFFDQIKPNVIGIERSPLEFERDDFYEFTYEQQNIVIPYAKENNIDIRPFDWLPSTDDQQLAWNTNDIDQSPIIRMENSNKSFLYFQKKSTLEDLFDLESEEVNQQIENWKTTIMPGANDFPRRLFLYRTFMQAMRIKHIAKGYIGKTVLIVVGHMHKRDIESILTEISYIDVVQPSEYGIPTRENVISNIRNEDLYAVASFNLLGVQSNHFVNWEWIRNVIQSLNEIQADLETEIFNIRFELLTRKIKSEDAISKYKNLLDNIEPNRKFKFNGVKDNSKIDSYYDPFGNLTVMNRVRLEIAREYYKGGNINEGERFRKHIMENDNLTQLQQLQLNAYWDDYVINMY